MIQFNLLPDVKLEYIRARRTKRLVMLGSTIVTSVSLAITIVLYTGVNVLQHQHLNNLTRDIDSDSKKLQQVPDLDKILTVQNQLNSLGDLHAKKPVVSRLGGYLSQLTPNEATIGKLEVNFDDSTMSFEGSAPGVDVVNKFIDTMKFTTFQAGNENGDAFSEVVLADFSRDADKATYQITLKFNPLIFDSANDVQLKVPNIVTTRSSLEKPGALFHDSNQGTSTGEEQ